MHYSFPIACLSHTCIENLVEGFAHQLKTSSTEKKYLLVASIESILFFKMSSLTSSMIVAVYIDILEGIPFDTVVTTNALSLFTTILGMHDGLP